MVTAPSVLLNPVAAGEGVVNDRDGDQDGGPDHAEGGELADLGIFPELEDRHRYHRRLRADEQDRHGQLFGGQEKDKNPTAEKRRRHQRQNNPAHGAKP